MAIVCPVLESIYGEPGPLPGGLGSLEGDPFYTSGPLSPLPSFGFKRGPGRPRKNPFPRKNQSELA
ncbi:hypothetical protein RAB80_018326 [Fusarium oxysporum f. sp. vasinfectum]|nr:hypothetical protein RAB80_018326 [Fusarium oxysporum f. sp. vasinfectum]